MAASITKGYSFGATEEVTAAKLHALVDSATISNIATSEIADSQITAAKLATNAVETAKIKDDNVTTAKIADDNVTFAKLDDDGDYGLFAGDWSFNEIALVEDDAPSTAADEGKIYTKDTGGQPELFFREESDGDEVQLTSDGSVYGAKIVQKVAATNSAVVTCNEQIPTDDTIPAASEGDEVTSVAITPTSTTNKLLVRASAGGTLSSDGGSALVMTLVKDDTVVAAKIADGAGSANIALGGIIEYYADAGTTSEVTFKLNVGCGTASRTIYINGDASGNRVFGGTSVASIVVEEIVV